MTTGRLLVVVATACLVTAAPTAAHVLVVPAAVADGATTRVELDAPNERDDPMTGLTVELPEGLTIDSAEAPTGWVVTTEDRSATWDGAALAAGATGRFPLAIRTERPAGQAMLTATQRYADGATARWDVAFTVLPATGDEAPPSHLARGLGAALAGVVLVAGIVGMLHRRRTRALQDG